MNLNQPTTRRELPVTSPAAQRPARTHPNDKPSLADTLTTADFLQHSHLTYADLTAVLVTNNRQNYPSKPATTASRQPIMATPALLERAHERLLKLRKSEEDDSQVTSNTAPTADPSTSKTDTAPAANVSTQKDHTTEKSKEPWQQHRHWLSVVFAVWFILAIGLLLTTMYSV